jgi:hypothetical protein
VKPEADDVFEIAALPFRLPLRNRMVVGEPVQVEVKAL